MKTYEVNPQIGKVKYSVSFHDGVKTHPDGSPFYDLEIFKTYAKLKAFVKQLRAEGYEPRGSGQ